MGNIIANNIIQKNENTQLISPIIDIIPEKKIYGWKRDIPDYRDLYYKRNIYDNELSKIIDLRNNCPEIYNQGTLGSCTANALAFLFEFDEIIKKHKDKEFRPSRLFIYYNERNMENTIESDAGASIRDGIKSIHTIGVCDEKLWSYDIDKFKEKPPTLCYTQAQKYKSITYYKLYFQALNLHNKFIIKKESKKNYLPRESSLTTTTPPTFNLVHGG